MNGLRCGAMRIIDAKVPRSFAPDSGVFFRMPFAGLPVRPTGTSNSQHEAEFQWMASELLAAALRLGCTMSITSVTLSEYLQGLQARFTPQEISDLVDQFPLFVLPHDAQAAKHAAFLPSSGMTATPACGATNCTGPTRTQVKHDSLILCSAARCGHIITHDVSKPSSMLAVGNILHSRQVPIVVTPLRSLFTP